MQKSFSFHAKYKDNRMVILNEKDGVFITYAEDKNDNLASISIYKNNLDLGTTRLVIEAIPIKPQAQ